MIAYSLDLIETFFSLDQSPTAISNGLLRAVREKSGVADPYAEMKKREFERAMGAGRRLEDYFPETLESALRSSAFGNGGDFFVEHNFDFEGSEFHCELDKIEAQVYPSGRILILGDNPGDFVFDRPLVNLLKTMGKEVFYAIKEGPVQNDMSMTDVRRFGADGLYDRVVSTGTDEVGMEREKMSGIVRKCWEDGSCVIAKGMGNFEAISEYDWERPVVYVMKVKCKSVAETLGRKVGEFIAIAGGDHG